MLKNILLAASVAVAVPAFGQDKPDSGNTRMRDQSVIPDQADPAAATPATQERIAQAVTRDFGNYDKDANGTLSQVEFGTWISILRKAIEPTFQPGGADAGIWIGQAFAATDLDRNRTIDQAELTSFLTPRAS